MTLHPKPSLKSRSLVWAEHGEEGPVVVTSIASRPTGVQIQLLVNIIYVDWLRHISRVFTMWKGNEMSTLSGNDRRSEDKPTSNHKYIDEFLILVVMGIGAFTALLVDFFGSTGLLGLGAS